MNWLLIANLVAAAVGLVHVICTLRAAEHLTFAQWRALPRKHLAIELAWTLGYCLLGAGATGVLLGPLYGLDPPHGWDVVINYGWAISLIAFYYYRTHILAPPTKPASTANAADTANANA